MTDHLPEYDAPPVVEMSLAVHFEALPELRSAYLGMFADYLLGQQREFAWSELEEDFPRPVAIEQFGRESFRPPFRLQIAEEVPPPRTVLRDSRRHRAVAIQQDAFEYSWWRDAEDGTYPRYTTLMAEFLPLLGSLRSFLEVRHMGVLRLRQAEVAYQNGLQRGVDWTEDGTAVEIMRSWTKLATEGLPPLEDAHFGQTHVLTGPEGVDPARLYITLDTNMPPPFRRGPETDWAALSLTFRGAIQGKGDDDEVKSVLGRGREAIVRSFTAVTTDEAHARWRRTR